MEKRKMPPAQAIVYVIEGALDSFEWLKKLQVEWENKVKEGQDGYFLRKRQRIVADAFTIYINSLFQKKDKVHSLVQSYQPHPFIKAFKNHKLVQQINLHRNNRSGHQSQYYGFMIPIQDILSSDIDSWLNDALYLVCTKQFLIKI